MTDHPTERRDWDVVVIGGGSAGENAAQYATQGGLSAVIVEAELLGGECSYWACMPSKALLRPVEVLALGRAMAGVREALTGELDVAAVLARRDRFTHEHDDASQLDWARDAGIDVVRGRGRLAGERAVAVLTAGGGQRTLHARHAVVLATGSAATIPPIDGLAAARPWTSRDVTNLRAVPERVAVIGGGVVACESTAWLVGLGARAVTVLERGPRLLARNEPFAGELVAQRFAELGVDVRLEATVESVRRTPVAAAVGVPRGEPATLVVDGGELVVDEIVVAAGRTPNTGDLGLETIGLVADGFLETDDHLAVRAVEGGWLYAVGDVNGRALLTHMGKYQARVCGDVIAARARGAALAGPRYRATADHGQVPQVAFTDPQVAAVGVSEREARDAGLAVRTVEIDLSVAGAALDRDGYRGRAKLVLDGAARTVVGATFAGPDVAELIHAATVAVVGRVCLDDLWHAVPSYPTIGEVWLRLLEAERRG